MQMKKAAFDNVLSMYRWHISFAYSSSSTKWEWFGDDNQQKRSILSGHRSSSPISRMSDASTRQVPVSMFLQQTLTIAEASCTDRRAVTWVPFGGKLLRVGIIYMGLVDRRAWSFDCGSLHNNCSISSGFMNPPAARMVWRKWKHSFRLCIVRRASINK